MALHYQHCCTSSLVAADRHTQQCMRWPRRGLAWLFIGLPSLSLLRRGSPLLLLLVLLGRGLKVSSDEGGNHRRPAAAVGVGGGGG